jgi:2-keto-4-pentenoate hydratase/2-oxohepta-3-ene-1,7-dioic acid hydratase in catechol pathway
MRLAAFDGGRLGLVDGDEVYDLTGAARATYGHGWRLADVLRAGQAGLALCAELRGQAAATALGAVTLAAPVPAPGKIIAAPVNYTDHMTEMSEVIDIRHLGVFLKAATSVTGPGGVVRLPYSDRRFDHEGELAVVIGRKAAGVSEEQALDVVFGYTCLLDMTMRGGEDRSLRKSFDTFTPLGPWIVTADELGDPSGLRLTCTVNGIARQDATTADLIWPVPRLIAYCSSAMTLLPGDIIATGTPAGVGPVSDGDHISVQIERIGTLTVSVSADGARPCPTQGAGRGPVPPPAPPPS